MALPTNLIHLEAPAFPVGYCPQSYEQFARDFIGGVVAGFNSDIGSTFFNTTSTTPSLENRLFPWIDGNGNWWVFKNGTWARRNPVPPNAPERRLWVGTVERLPCYDGGSPGEVTETTGPMWEVDASFDGRFPVGVGTFDQSGTIAVGDTITDSGFAGLDRVDLIVTNLPEHTHDVAIQVPGYGGQDGERKSYDDGTNSTPLTNDTEAFPTALLNPKVQAESVAFGPSNQTPHNNLPPFKSAYVIKRTSRVYYTADTTGAECDAFIEPPQDGGCSLPVITQQPQFTVATTGENATFSVVASNAQSLSYQWFKGAAQIGGATGSSYTITNVTAGDAGQYSVKVSSQCGTVTSLAADLYVIMSQDLSVAGRIDVPTDQTYIIVLNAPVAGRIDSFTYKTTSGSATLAVQIDAVNVTGLSGLGLTTVEATANATAANTFAVGQTIQIVVSSNSSSVNFDWVIKMTRT